MGVEWWTPKTKESKGKKETITLWCTNVGLRFAKGLRILEKKKEKKKPAPLRSSALEQKM